jgi:hypothetical protein
MRVQLRSTLPLAAVLALGCQGSDTGVTSSAVDGAIQARGVASETITFEGFANGAILSEVYGDGGSGPIAMSGSNPALGAVNAAIIFDSANPLPAADDYDLGTPNETFSGPGIGEGGEMGMPYENDTAHGNIAIIAENLEDGDGDGNIDVPDDATNGDEEFNFDFTAVGTGVVTIHEITIIDVEPIEDAATVDLYDAAMVLLDSFTLPQTGDNGVSVESLGPTEGVAYMVVTLNGSGGIDNIVFTRNDEETGGEGCTPGYWKNHEDEWVGYTTDQTVSEVFSSAAAYSDIAGDSIHEALKYGGGPGALGAAKLLVHHGVAALLNASSAVEYELTTAEILTAVNDALDTGDRDTMLDAKDELDMYNNAGCPLN